MTKAKCQERHARRRLWQRYGLHISDKQYNEMCRKCAQNEYVCYLGRQSLRLSKAVILYRDEYIPVIYDKVRKRIVTVLTLDMLSADEQAILQKQISFCDNGDNQ